MYKVKIIDKKDVTHDVKSYVVEKPDGYDFEPGQAVMVAIDKKDWEDEKRPFTFTSLPDDDHLEFTIKTYSRNENSNHSGMTEELGNIKVGDSLIIGEPMGAIKYKGPGVFIAGGAGITPFLAMLRKLHKEHKLEGHKVIFSNKTINDVVQREELEKYLGDDLYLSFTQKEVDDFHFGRIDESFLKDNIKDYSQIFYICGPRPMVSDIKKILQKLGAKPETLVFEG